MCRIGLLIVLATGSLVEAASEAAGRAIQAAPPPEPFLAGHPMLSALAHILFLTIIIGMGAAVVAALFKPPFEN